MFKIISFALLMAVSGVQAQGSGGFFDWLFSLLNPHRDNNPISIPSAPNSIFSNASLVNLTCSNDTQTAVCPYSPEGFEWVCRTLYNVYTGDPIKFSTCVDPTVALEQDTCGCCGGDCPMKCNCTCDVLFSGDNSGVLVNVTDMDGTVEQECILPALAYINVVRNPRYACDKSC